MRALLVFNPNATTTDDDVRDVIASALSSAVDLTVVPTKQRGHATHLVAGAIHEGVEVICALGGDGTANEVIQALAGTDVRLGIIPGGGANVLARALGLPNDAVHATKIVLDRLRSGQDRRISLGRAGERYFGFNAGFGFDAAVIRYVEQHTRVKRVAHHLAFVVSTVREWVIGSGRDDPSIMVTLADGSRRGPVAASLIANTDPYTYLGPRPMRVHPQASFDAGLDLLTVDDLASARTLRVVAGTFRSGSHVGLRGVDYLHDQPSFTLSSSEPLPLMVDGDYAGEHAAVTFTSVPDALRILA